jgi:hypothetical protein
VWKSNVVSPYVHLGAEDANAVLERMNEKILGKQMYGSSLSIAWHPTN